jgi:cell division protein FtsB
VRAEQRLSQQLAEISGFEFVVRSRLEPLSRRLEGLEDEIRLLQKELRRLREDHLFFADFEQGELYEAWRSSEEAGSAAAGDFRYHEAPSRLPRQALSDDENEKLKNLYRQLARRFHPDFAVDEEDRAYRTGIMMAINAAYTAGDLGRLNELAARPDPQQPDLTDEELAKALTKEIEHCRSRIAEIAKELERLHKHPSALLKKRVEEAARKDRDLLEELAVDLRDKIAERMAQRDVLQAEIENFENGEPDFADAAFADAVFNLGLEQAYVTEDERSGLFEWRERNHERFDLDESDDEAVWEALRKLRDKK